MCQIVPWFVATQATLYLPSFFCSRNCLQMELLPLLVYITATFAQSSASSVSVSSTATESPTLPSTTTPSLAQCPTPYQQSDPIDDSACQPCRNPNEAVTLTLTVTSSRRPTRTPSATFVTLLPLPFCNYLLPTLTSLQPVPTVVVSTSLAEPASYAGSEGVKPEIIALICICSGTLLVGLIGVALYLHHLRQSALEKENDSFRDKRISRSRTPPNGNTPLTETLAFF
jgi:hypothetical protein